jgi:hypothetical protein
MPPLSELDISRSLPLHLNSSPTFFILTSDFFWTTRTFFGIPFFCVRTQKEEPRDNLSPAFQSSGASCRIWGAKTVAANDSAAFRELAEL